MDNDDDLFRQAVLKKLDLIVLWLKLANIQAVKDYYSNILDTDQKRLAYTMSNGDNTIGNIMEATGIKSTQTVSSWWNDWMSKGIMSESETRQGRKEKTIDLSELGF